MKLSEAIRTGSKMKPQGFKALFMEVVSYDTYLGRTIASCALGAALDGAGKSNEFNPLYEVPDTVLNEEFPILLEFTLVPPLPRIGKGRIISTIIIDLNDGLQWTREAIADWVEKEELAREQRDEFKRMEKCINAEKGVPETISVLVTSS